MRFQILQRSMTQAVVAAGLCCAVLVVPAFATDVGTSRSSLDQGFQLLYNLDFDQAHEMFLAWQREHPQDPVGPTAEAAGLLFSEFHRLGILEAQFYADDKSFLNREKIAPDPGLREGFNAALTRAQNVTTAPSATHSQ